MANIQAAHVGYVPRCSVKSLRHRSRNLRPSANKVGNGSAVFSVMSSYRNFLACQAAEFSETKHTITELKLFAGITVNPQLVERVVCF